MRYAELFAGGGGMSLGLEAAGFAPFAHAEIEPHARAVLRYHWPDVRLDGDVTQINGADYAGVTLLSGGSPCQDLSVAGKRAGLTGSRSSLFHEQCRIWRESGAPYLLWENVHGAFSSNGGKDFATVLSTLVGATIPVPADGWQSGGVAAGRDAVAAWRVLDLQHFGPPQRRVRVFVLAARAGGVDPAEVLALSEGVCGHPSPRQQAREGVTGGAAGGVGAGGVIPIGEATARQGEAHGSSVMIGAPGDPMFTLTSKQHAVSYAIGLDGEKNADIELIGTLNTGSKSGSGQNPAVLAFGAQNSAAQGASVSYHITPTLDKSKTPGVIQTLTVGGRDKGAGDSYDNTPVIAQAVAFAVRGREGGGMAEVSEVSPSLRTPGGGSSHAHVICTTGHVTHVLNDQGGSVMSTEVELAGCLRAATHGNNQIVVRSGADASEDGTGRGTPIVAFGNVGMESWKEQDVTVTACARDAKGANNVVVGTLDFGGHGGSYNGQDAYQGRIRAEAGRPRRLTPRECERLMSWPDDWTRYGRKEDGTVYELSDTARYRLCGNGVGSMCAAWIARRLAWAIAREASC